MAARAERSASTCFQNIQVCINKKDFDKAQYWLDRLTTKYGATKFVAAHRADIAALRTQIDAYVKATAKPTPPKPPPPQPGTRKPQPPPLPPPPDDDERWTEWEDLFDGKTLKSWGVLERGVCVGHGKVHVVDGRMVLERGRVSTGIHVEQDFPADDYEITLDVMAEPGCREVFRMTFPLGASRCEVLLRASNTRIGMLSRVDGQDLEVSAPTPGMRLHYGRWYQVRHRVTKRKIETWADADKVIDLPRAGHQFRVEGAKSPGLGSKERGPNFYVVGGRASLRNIRLRRLKPDARPEAKAVPWTVYTKWPFDAAEAKRRQSETAKALGVPVEQDIALGNGVKLTMVLIPAGEFLMGSPPTTSPEKLSAASGGKPEDYEGEFPQHRVKISRPFWMAKHEVTQEQWMALFPTNPSRYKGTPKKPVEQVVWNQAHEFAKVLSEKLQKAFRLPTEAEWEYACRAGTATEFYFGNDAAKVADFGWVGVRSTASVAQKKPNAWGLCDMAGNVWEWVEDWFAKYEGGAQTDPKGAPAGERRVLRGGSWGGDPGGLRSAYRHSDRPDHRYGSIGFRLILAPVAVRPPAVPSMPPPPTQQEERRPAAQATEADAALAKLLEPVEAKVAAWDFAGAAAGLARIKNPPGGSETSGRVRQELARRREEVERLVTLKAKMIERINTAKPRLRKSSIFLKGMNADLVKADEKGITTAKLPTGKTETFAWQDLSARSAMQLARLSIDAKSADDWLAVGLLALHTLRAPVAATHASPQARHASPLQDVTAAEQAFEKARKLGASIPRYLDPLAAASFARAKALLQEALGVGTPRLQEGRGAETPRPQREKKFGDAAKALAELETKYAKTPWFASHKQEVEAAREQAKAGIAEAEAEELYARAAALFKKQDLWALKPVIDKLKADYPNAKLLTDAARKPAFADMAAAVAKLGKFITVRQDGKGDFKSIQAAIDAAPAGSLIEVQDNGPYGELIEIPEDRAGLTLRGGRGCWPLITSQGTGRRFPFLVKVHAPRAVVERVLLVHTTSFNEPAAALSATSSATSFALRSAVLYCNSTQSGCSIASEGTITGCFITRAIAASRTLVTDTISRGHGSHNYVSRARNSVLPGLVCKAVDLRSCTVPGRVTLRGGPNVIVDCIVGSIDTPALDTRVEHCDVYGEAPFIDRAKPGKRCFSRDPQFRNPDILDYRLKPTSPCRGKASDGGEIGCRYTPEMLEMLKLAHELRKKGIIKF